MASLLSHRRTDPEIALRTTVAHTQPSGPRPPEAELPRVSWLLAAVGGALASALAGWILVVGLTVVGWLAADPGTLLGAVGVGTQLWFLANGAGAELGSATLTLIPWAATALFAFMVSRFAGFAARQTRGRPLRRAAAVTAATAVSYAVAVAGTVLFLSGPDQALRGLGTAGLIAALAAGWGSCRALRLDLSQSWPPWCRAVPRAVLGAQLAMVASGAAALVTGLVLHLDRVVSLTEGLGAGVLGGIALAVVQLAFVPNAVIWAGSYTLGAGFSLGQGSVVAPAATQLGLLPSVPLLGALPSTGPGSLTELWWMASGVLAGGVAAWVVMRARPVARFDETSLVGGLSGLLAGVVFVGLGWATSGDLGTVLLTGMGPRLLALLVLSPITMGLAGLLVGLVVGLLRRPSRARGAGARPARGRGKRDGAEETTTLRRSRGARPARPETDEETAVLRSRKGARVDEPADDRPGQQAHGADEDTEVLPIRPTRS